MAQKADILVLGATGFTGKLVVRYLSTHPEYTSSPRKFTFALAGRSRDRLSKIAAEHHLPAADVPLITVDTNSISDIDIAISSARVVINVVGPFWKYSRGVAIACAARGVHYVDLTGEAPFMRYVIDACDVPARASGAILIPGSGQDCIPSDLTVFLANKTLKARFPERTLAKSTSAFHARGEVSGGTISTLYSFFEDIPAEVRKGTRGPWALSPVKGARQPGIKFTYDLPYEKLVGGFWMMAPIDKAVVLRSWGLFERAAKEKPGDDEAQALAYGPEFAYDEFMVTKNKLIGAALTFGLFFMVILAAIPPTRWLMKRLLPQPGSGPSEESMQNGFLKVTNMTYSSGDEVGRRALIRTRWEGRGDPGYLLTSILIAESALALALDHDRLPALARSGGAFTPATALGDVLLERLKRTGRMKFESQIVSESA